MALLPPRPYSRREIARFEQKIDQSFQKGKPIDYEAWVDGLRVIDRTNDPEEFVMLEDYIDPKETKEVRIKIFHSSATNVNNTHVLYFEKEKPVTGLQGIDNRIEERIQREKERWDFEQLKAEHKRLATERDQLKADLDEASKELEDFRGKKLILGNINLLELGGVALEGFIRRNPQILHKLPGGQALAGIITEDNQRMALNPGEGEAQEEEQAATFSRADASEVSTEDRPYLELLKRIQSSFSQDDFVQVMEILDRCIAKPDLIPTLRDLIEDEQTNLSFS